MIPFLTPDSLTRFNVHIVHFKQRNSQKSEGMEFEKLGINQIVTTKNKKSDCILKSVFGSLQRAKIRVSLCPLIQTDYRNILWICCLSILEYFYMHCHSFINMNLYFPDMCTLDINEAARECTFKKMHYFDSLLALSMLTNITSKKTFL